MKRRLLIGAIITLLIFPLLGWGILGIFRESPLQLMMRSEHSFLIQIPIGILLGMVLGFGAKFLISRNYLRTTLNKYSRIIGSLHLSEIDIIFISFCAGFGEELLFRGSIQILLGVWVTAIFFVAIHGYLSPRNWRLSSYGIYMTMAIAIIGYSGEYFGILSACIAHMIIDIILFYHLQRNFRLISS